LYSGNEATVMSDEVLEQYITKHIAAATEKIITFTWHGGEPTLAGLNFYKKVVALQQKNCPTDRLIINGIQTNATLLDDNWCSFLAQEKFLVGISLDGTENLHGIHRFTSNKQNSFRKTLAGYHKLLEFGITPEILCVVHSHNVAYPLEIYHFFKTLKPQHITFLPLVEFDPKSPTRVSYDSVPALAFGQFMSTIFDEWVSEDIGAIKIQLFEEATRTAFNMEHTLCIFKTTCGGVPVLEANGDIYSCDHFVSPTHYLGNIRKSSLIELLESAKQKTFGLAKQQTLPTCCLKCEVRAMCNGECPKNRFLKSPDGEQGLNYLCAGYKFFFHHCSGFINAVAHLHNDFNGLQISVLLR